MVYLQFGAHDMSSLSVLFQTCSRVISVVLEGGCGIFHPRGVCITWLPYLSVAGIENQLRKSLFKLGKARWESAGLQVGESCHSSAHRSCLAACRAVIFFLSGRLKYGNCTVAPLKLGKRDHSSKTKRWARGGAWKTIVNIRRWIGTSIKWHHGCVPIDFLLTLLEVICFCFKVACLVSTVSSAENSPTRSHRREQ